MDSARNYKIQASRNIEAEKSWESQLLSSKDTMLMMYIFPASFFKYHLLLWSEYFIYNLGCVK